VPKAVAGLLDVSKSFGSIAALDGVTVELTGGAVHAIVGENGAGKSTMVNILSGVHSPDSGNVMLAGAPVKFRAPSDAMRAGIATIYQERALVQQLTVGENIVLGHERSRLGVIETRREQSFARSFLDQVHLAVSPRRRLASLRLAEQQLVAIAKALSLNAQLLILDEPTAALTSEEAENLFSLIGRLRERGIAVLYITHRLREVEQIADTVTVLKDGRLVRTLAAVGATEAVIVPLMVGREVDQLFPTLSTPSTDVVLEARDLELPGALRGVSLAVRAGEIAGVAGLEGSGKSALARVLAGGETPSRGSIHVRGSQLKGRGILEALAHGVGYIPPDRRAQAIIRTFSVRASTTLAGLRRFSQFGFVLNRKERRAANEIRERLDIRTRSIEAPVLTLSGGNQQKVVLGRVLVAGSDVLVCDEPTAGVDVGARAEIYEILAELATQGSAVVVVSSDVLELMGLCHRILVMREGRIVQEFRQGSASEEDLVRAQLPRHEEGVKPAVGAA
jgi:ABC-type sugar transport system ATPase subunit